MEKNMEENFEKILQRQQELEYLKKQNTGSKRQLQQLSQKLGSDYSRQILSQCSKIHTIIRKRRFFSLMRKIFLTLSAALFIFIFLALFRLRPFADSGLSTEETDPFGDLPMVQLQRAANDNDFDKVRDIIKENDFKPDTFVTAWVFSMLYEHDQDYDQAATVILDFIDNYFDVRNMTKLSILYTQLVQVGTHHLSPDVQKRYDECIAQCEKGNARRMAIWSLMNDQKYEEALELCKDFHESGISYSVLFEDYNLCYKHLEKYEEYAEFLIDIAKQLPEEDDYYDDLPDRYRVINCLKSVYPKVSEETQKKIDELGVIEAAKQ